MARKVVIIAVLITIGFLVYLFFPRDSVISYFGDAIDSVKQQERKFDTNTTQPQPAPVPQPVQPAPPAAQMKPVSDYLKIRRMADGNQVRIMYFEEPQIGSATMRLRAGDKNDIFNLLDAIERGISLRDIENVSKGYKIMQDNEGRQIVEAVIWIKYIPRFQ